MRHVNAQVAADSAMEQITNAISAAGARKAETERLKEDLAMNEKATQARKADIEQVPHAPSDRVPFASYTRDFVLVSSPVLARETANSTFL